MSVWVGLSGLVLLSLIVAGQEVRRAPSGTGVLERLAREARIMGRNTVDLSVHTEATTVRHLDQAFQYYSVLVVQPVGQETVATDDAYTWCKSRVFEVLSRPTRTGALAASPLDTLPPEWHRAISFAGGLGDPVPEARRHREMWQECG